MDISKLLSTHDRLDGQVTRVAWSLQPSAPPLSNQVRRNVLQAVGEHCLQITAFARKMGIEGHETHQSAAFLANCWSCIYDLALAHIGSAPSGSNWPDTSRREWRLMIDQTRALLAAEADLLGHDLNRSTDRVRIIDC